MDAPADQDILDLNTLPEAYYGFIYHYYRAEVYRETNWRNRLDTTTNWSIVVTAALLSFVFTNEVAPHSIIFVNYLLVWFFLYIESRRFRYYTLLRERTRIIEKRLLSQIFLGKSKKLDDTNWRERLAATFKHLKVPITRLESVAWRIRRNYSLIILLIFVSWLAKVSNYPVKAHDFWTLMENAQVWIIPGFVVFWAFLVSVLFAVFIAYYVPSISKHSDLP